ncbi:MAG TPA: GAF domain-containing sensor histidine kinase [Thermomicrobiales bacterium]|nr:GAF domain-containing sensor histidine kinase [Thermomicrobiales bacterium]
MTTTLSEQLLARVRDEQRLAALRRLDLVDTPPEEAFDRVTRLAARLLGVRVALITLIEADRQFLKSCLGVPAAREASRQAPITYGLCPYTLALGRPLLLADARETPPYRDNPFVAELGIAGYAGVPLATTDDQIIGILCVADTRPRAWGRDDLATLQDLAAVVMTEIALRVTAREARRQADEAEAAIRARDEFLATLSHDLKSPLSTIKGYAQLLRMRAGRDETPTATPGVADGAAKIEATANKMNALINELLDVARLEAGGALDLERAPTDLVALAAEAIAAQRPNAEDRLLELVAPEAALVGAWDPVRLERVLDNLLGNAIKYSRPGGAVVVRVARDGDRAALTVRDDGVGIPAADLPRIFERFHRGRNVAGRVAGTGLGLPGARHIVEQHGGTIDVASREGLGTTVTVHLPLAGPDGAG